MGDPDLYELLWRRWLAPTFADEALGDVSVEMVRTWLAEARIDHSSSTQPAKAYRLLRAVLNVALDDDKILANPCRIKGAGKECAPERPVAMPEQVLAIVDAIDSQYRALVIMSAWCVLRFGGRSVSLSRRERVALPRPARLRNYVGRGRGRHPARDDAPWGWSTHTAALRYQHATNERNREIADRLGALLGTLHERGGDVHQLRS